MKHIYNVTADQVLENATVVFDAIHPEDRRHVQESIELSRASGGDWIAEYRVINNGETRWVFGRAKPEFLGDGTVLWHGAILDITTQKNLEAQLRQIATTDELTGAANRRHFMNLLSREFERYKRRGPDYSMILFDFDWFKRINDQYGHGVGDLVLKTVARQIQSQLRSGDTFGRIGGEEFGILLPQTGEDSARQLAERLRHSVEILEYGQNDGLRGTITCGVASSRSGDIEPNHIILRADKAMYQGKAQGRNRVIVFRP
jgi:diguanylate cyclase (GGDEF)-like protein